MAEQLDIGYETSISPLDTLAAELNCRWANLQRARQLAYAERRKLEAAFSGFYSADASIVVFGSLARDEFTSGSDIDWTLLVDSMADPAHLDVALAIRRRLAELQGKAPGPEGTFGTLAFSHELVHQIGGQDDTNANTTRRILMLLESRVLGRPEAYSRVVSNVLHRYLSEDRGLWYGSSKAKVPRFLLNDIARYWRTMAVDFAYKQRARGNEGWALRNIKLRLSRKLLFISGLLACFSCHLDLNSEQKKLIFAGHAVQPLVAHLQRILSFTPLELLASAVLREKAVYPAATRMFNAYDAFIEMLANDEKLRSGKTPRQHLNDLAVDDLDADETFAEAREISHQFQDAIQEIFLYSDTDLARLTVEYGVF